MSLIRWNGSKLFPDFSNVVDSFVNESWDNVGKHRSSNPSINISENDEAFRLEVATPGLQKENFNLDLCENVLTISAKKEMENTEEKKNEEGKVKYTRREFSYNSFERSFTLPNSIKQEDIQASYEDGILNVTLPKKEDAKQKEARQINIS